MKLAMLPAPHPTNEDSGLDDPAGRLSVINGAASVAPPPWPHGAPVPIAPRRYPVPIVRVPVDSGREPATPRVVAQADLQVKRFHGRRADDQRYTATLHPASTAPAELLAALTEAAREIEDFTRAGSPEDHLILTIAIRR